MGIKQLLKQSYCQMKNKLVLFVIWTIALGCNREHSLAHQNSYPEYFKINRIESWHNGFYIIYASRNDSLFKIVEWKSREVGYQDLEKIRKGRYYKLYLEDMNKPSVIDGYLFLPGMPLLLINGEKIGYNRKSHYTLYKALNVKGLYLVPFSSAETPLNE